MSRMRRLSAVALCVIALPGLAWAQVDSARIAGTVADQTGGFIRGAKVTVTNEKVGDARTAETTSEGFFLVTALKPSTYTVKVEQPGFAPLGIEQGQHQAEHHPDGAVVAGLAQRLCRGLQPGRVTAGPHQAQQLEIGFVHRRAG